MLRMIDDVSALVQEECNRAKEEHGKLYASFHEGNGVLLEELQEGWEEGKNLTTMHNDLTYFIRVDAYRDIRSALESIKKTAILAACEYIQVAAVAQKMLDGMTDE